MDGHPAAPAADRTPPTVRLAVYIRSDLRFCRWSRAPGRGQAAGASVPGSSWRYRPRPGGTARRRPPRVSGRRNRARDGRRCRASPGRSSAAHRDGRPPLILAGSGEPQFGPSRSAVSVRTVSLPSVVGESLAAHLERWPAGTDGLIFTNERGDRRGPSSEWRVIPAVIHRRCWLPGTPTIHVGAARLLRRLRRRSRTTRDVGYGLVPTHNDDASAQIAKVVAREERAHRLGHGRGVLRFDSQDDDASVGPRWVSRMSPNPRSSVMRSRSSRVLAARTSASVAPVRFSLATVSAS
jgi:hypothetical protein